MTRVHEILIDAEKCVGCGECLRVCPSEVIEMRDGKALALRPEKSMLCGHCEAVCPVGAVRVPALDDWAAGFTTFEAAEDEAALPALAALMRGRRSCRNYLREPVPEDELEDLVRLAVSAPSGTNSQKWTFTLLPDREAVLDLGRTVAGFFGRLNRKAEKAWLRKTLALAGKGELEGYYRGYYAKVADALRRWNETGEDLLFHGAPAAVIVGSRPGASCPAEDALLATGQMLLAARAMGLGTCLVGYAVEAMRRDPVVQKAVGMPGEETVYAVMALGRPDEKYLRPAGRMKPLLRYHRG